ncbi:MAG: hypothetical protein GY869_15480 [Planctomycetes bacterium]|nr:hypothetical protein [Planctomycetota bacterium]
MVMVVKEATAATATVVEEAMERVAVAEVAVEGTEVAVMATGAAAITGATAAAMGTGMAATEATEATAVVGTGTAATTGATAAMMRIGMAATEAMAVVDGVAGQNKPLCLQDLRLDFFQIAEDLNLNICLMPSGEIWIEQQDVPSIKCEEIPKNGVLWTVNLGEGEILTYRQPNWNRGWQYFIDGMRELCMLVFV